MTAPTLAPTMTEGRKVFLHCVFTTAMEGGISYWAEALNYHWMNPNRRPESTIMDTYSLDLDNFHATIVSSEGDWGIDKAWQTSASGRFIVETNISGTVPLIIDRRVIERGVGLMVDKVMAAVHSEDTDAPFSRKYLRQFVVQYLTDGEDGDSDADVCDMVVQLGLFGELVYA